MSSNPWDVVTSLFTDGGIVGRNPSPIGGTWAWCWVDVNDERICSCSGAVEPSDLGVEACTNNQLELLAALRGLKSLPPWWSGKLYTDSRVTLCRLVGREPRVNGLPGWMVDVLREVKEGRRLRVELVKGHPKEVDLNRGRDRRGRPVSEHNRHVDLLCNWAKAVLLG